MSAQRVDVLARLKLMARQAWSYRERTPDFNAETRKSAATRDDEAIAVVRELVEAARDLSADIEFMINDPRCAKHDRLRAALERFGGTP